MTAMDGFRHCKHFGLPRLVPILALLLGATGCGGGSGGAGGMTSPPAPAVVPASISAQPSDQSVPMGLSATYSVTATGSSLQYQWARNGAEIAGATGSTYVTPATGFADTGSRFTVTVSNSAGTVTSNAALLTVTARAPMAGDLRFQQVDAPSTVNGWGNAGVGESSFLLGRMALSFSPSIGIPFYVGSNGNCGTTPSTDGTGCSWAFTEVPLAVTPSSPALLAGYASDLFDNFEADILTPPASQNPPWPAFGKGITPASSASVITSLDLEPADILFGVAWVQSAQQSGFELTLNTVAAANLQAAAMHEGASGRVITAISNNGGSATYLAYGWSADPATVYEVEVTTASTSQAATAAAGLASAGYIITATGQADNAGNLYLVGTRVQGDTMARPFIAAPGGAQNQLMQQGYAIVGVIFDSTQTDPYTYLGER